MYLRLSLNPEECEGEYHSIDEALDELIEYLHTVGRSDIKVEVIREKAKRGLLRLVPNA